MNKEFNDQIKKIVSENPSYYTSLLLKSKKYEHLRKYINDELCDFQDLPLPNKIYWILNGIKEYPKCCVCGINELKHNAKCHPLNGYVTTTCSNSCGQKNPKTRETKRQNSIKKYGTDCPQKSEEYRNNLKVIFSKKSISEIEKSNLKRINTCKQKYGVEYISQNDSIKRKFSETWKSFSEDKKKDIVERSLKTKAEIYGIDNLSNQKKQKETTSKFSIEKINEINEKRKNTMKEKYGVYYGIESENAKEKSRNSRRKKYFEEYISNNEFATPLFSCDDYLRSTDDSKLKWKCKKCGNEFNSDIHEHQSHIARCLKCYPLSSPVSSYEKEIIEFIKTFYSGNISENKRDIIPPNEIDVYIPEKKIAIEFDGLYWHSENMGTPKDYHLNKTIKCDEKGIRLIHVFENEWIYKKEIIMSRIKNMFGLYEKTIYARQCSIKVVDIDISNRFQDKNHIQGHINSKINLGLYYNDELVSLMTFGGSRFNKKYEYELLRFCSLLGYHIPGAASKLLKYFERNYNPTSIVTYADRRWSIGNVYNSLGFKFVNNSKPNYWYWNHHKNTGLESRIKYQKFKLKKLFNDYDENKSEYQIMTEHGYYRIFDCGNMVFEKIY